MKATEYYIPSLPPHLLKKIKVNQKIADATAAVAHQNSRQFIWPVITKEDHRKTLNNYRSYIQAVNDTIPVYNQAVSKYNTKVRKHLQKNTASEKTEKLISLFLKHNNSLIDSEYNKAVKSFNSKHGLYILKRTAKPVRPVSLQVFEAILHAYTVQLRAYSKLWQRSGKLTPTTLPKVSIHPYEIVHQERGEGIQNLDLSTRTIRRHRDRLEEVGILESKDYRGRSRPVNYFISDVILSVSEGLNLKNKTTENQQLTPSKLTSCQDNKVSTRTNRNNKEIKGIVNYNSRNRNAPSELSHKIIFYKITDSQVAKNETGAAEKNINPEAKIPKDYNKYGELIGNLDSRYDLAQKLANGEYDFYSPIPIKQLNEIAATTVSDDDFRDLCVQDFARSAAQINRYNHSGAGSWYLALGKIDTDFKCFNFRGRAQTKSKVLQRLIEFRYRLRWAINWFERRGWKNRPFANRYFDPYRTLPTDVCWQYTKKIWTKKMKQKTAVAARKKQKAAAAIRRKEALSADRKARKMLDNAIYRYLRNEIDFQQLSEYVIKQLPAKQQEQLSSRLQELTIRRLT